MTEKKNAGITRNRDNPSSARRLHDKVYPKRYSSPTNVSRERKIEEENKEPEEEIMYEEDEEDQENEDVSRVTHL